MMEFCRRHAIALMLIAAAILSVAAWGLWGKLQTGLLAPRQVPRQAIRIALSKAVLTAPVIVAHERGFFSDAGLEVEMNDQFSSGKTAFEAMLAGEADIATVATTPAVFYGFQRQDFSLFVTYTTSTDGVKIIAGKDAGIVDAFSLKGKNIGVVPGTISHFLTISFLAYHKILLDEVNLFEFKASELPEALKAQKVDAIAAWEPFADQALELLGDGGIRIPSSKVYRQAILFAVRNDFAAQHPRALERVIRGLQKAMNVIAEENETVQALIAESLQLKPEFITDIWDDFTFQLSLDQLLLITMEEEARWAIRFGYTTEAEVPNYLSLLYPDALLAVQPEAVSVVLKE